MQAFLAEQVTPTANGAEYLEKLAGFLKAHGAQGHGLIEGLQRLSRAMDDLSKGTPPPEAAQIMASASIPLEAAKLALDHITPQDPLAQCDKIELSLGLKTFAIAMDKTFPALVQVPQSWASRVAGNTKPADIADQFGAFLASDILFVDGQKFTPYEAIEKLKNGVAQFKELRRELVNDDPSLKHTLPTPSELDRLHDQVDALMKNLQQLETLSTTRSSEDHPNWDILSKWSKPVEAFQKAADQIFDAYITTHEPQAAGHTEATRHEEAGQPASLGQTQKALVAQITGEIKRGFQPLDMLMLALKPPANREFPI